MALLISLVLVAVSASVALAAPGDSDWSFSGDGRLIINYGGSDAAQDVLVQPDGKIVIAGYGSPAKDFRVARVHADGLFDHSFDFEGTTGIDFGGDDYGHAAALQSNGKIVVAGSSRAGGNTNVAVARFNANGSPDLSFDGDGRRTIDYGGTDTASDVLVQPDGKIVVAGYGSPGADFTASRMFPDGSLDAGFGGNGTIGVNLGLTDIGYAVMRQPDGKIVIAGVTDAFGDEDVMVIRVKANGSLDTSFAGDGRQTIDYTGLDYASDVLMQPNGRIVVAGGGRPGTDFTASRVFPDGSPDASFGGNGSIGVDFGSFDNGYAAARQSNGKIVVAGFTGVNNDPALMRLQPGGSLDTTFSSDGKHTFAFPGFAGAHALALQPDGKILTAGYIGGDFFVARTEGD